MINLSEIDAVIFDFDGVLTDNKVYVNEHGVESVVCSRADGLAFSAFRKLSVNVYIMSTEVNPVVSARASKLKVPVIQAVGNKAIALTDLAFQNNWNLNKVMFVGNDLNDFNAMNKCGFKVCPSDSHPKIIEIADYVLESQGGRGVARELVEQIFELNLIELGDKL